MKKTYILLLLIAIIVFILFDVFLWINYQKRIILPNINTYYPTNYNQNTNSTAILNTAAPTNLNLPLNQNVNQPANANYNLNQSMNINGTGQGQVLATDQIVLLIKNKIINNPAPTQFGIRQIRQEIIDVAKTQDVEPALIFIANEKENFKQRFIALNTLFILELDKENKNIIVINALKSLLNDNDFQIQLLAAEYLVMLGYKEGFPTLIEGINNIDIAAFSDPPTPIYSETYNLLKSMTQKDFGPDYGSWRNWWRQNQDSLQWNGQKQIYE
jgi:hypothetical protein